MRIALVQRTLDPPGGGNAVAAWMVHALAPAHDVVTITERPWHADAVNAFYGTAIDPARVVQVHTAWPWSLVRRLPGRLDRLRMAVIERRAHDVAADRYVTADNYAVFPRPGLQYVHFPAPLDPEPREPRALVVPYFRATDRIARGSRHRAAANRTLANSAWTAARLPEPVRARAVVLYPPVPDPGTGDAWAARVDEVLCVGRFHGSKRLDLAIEIVRRAREHVAGLRLALVGSTVDARCARRLRALAAPHTWVTIEEDLPQPALHARMRRARFGLHLMVDEHFGIAPAEMARAGCLPLVHDSGGLVEVVGGRPDLRWGTEDEAVARLAALANAPARAEALSRSLALESARFSTDRFVAEFLALVEGR